MNRGIHKMDGFTVHLFDVLTVKNARLTMINLTTLNRVF
jgi:hypothetical protein